MLLCSTHVWQVHDEKVVSEAPFRVSSLLPQNLQRPAHLIALRFPCEEVVDMEAQHDADGGSG
ncbi:hypothetical protein EAO75_06725 [Streptomyces sp. uw30]|nr:hypothetical protein EAO75_06725 [Streptomyces sp. uw30]